MVGNNPLEFYHNVLQTQRFKNEQFQHIIRINLCLILCEKIFLFIIFKISYSADMQNNICIKYIKAGKLKLFYTDFLTGI